MVADAPETKRVAAGRVLYEHGPHIIPWYALNVKEQEFFVGWAEHQDIYYPKPRATE